MDGYLLRFASSFNSGALFSGGLGVMGIFRFDLTLPGDALFSHEEDALDSMAIMSGDCF